ncbi:hypothetical protein [Trichococcus ilyis]|uniref:Uncharacterized protein n=1 Tax=Trichococcus ilyis TaxID=640938 RepID=A0A143Z882_9LACT|nr:hypothetical protein [Trichococcus ilyis]CZR08609.1 Hypothetical protein TR210_2606 [Trichococcus ilyis]SEJ78148.1 hypothetical protein SAMN05216375_12633 [Trichococcus ilyis]
MKFYDDHQQKVRHQFGYYSVLVMTALLLVYVSMPEDQFGGISSQNAIKIIIMITALFFSVNVVYRHAFFDQYTRRPFWSNAFFLAMAGLQAQQAYQLYQLGRALPEPINKMEFLMLHSLQIALYLSIPLTYGVRRLIDRLAAKEQNKEKSRQSS